MNNKILKIAIIGITSLMIASGFPANVVADSEQTTVWVDDDYDPSTPGWGVTHFSSIQDGINAVQTNGIVFVYNGTYYEHVLINKRINLIGENKYSTIIDGNGSGNVIKISYTRANISGFNLKKGYCCIYLYRSHDCEIRDCIIETNLTNYGADGIKLYSDCDSNIIRENTFINNYNGINIDTSSDNNLVYHNNFINNDYNVNNNGNNNQWYNSYLGEGNYWDDYTGYDINGDGIGDEPYQKEGIDDQYPLVMEYPMTIKANFKWVRLNLSDLSTITFIDQSSEPYTTIINHTWNMGDGTILYGENITHTYAEPGVYEVSLFIVDDEGNADEQIKPVVAMSSENQNPDLLIVLSPQYKDDIDISDSINNYKTAVYNDLQWRGTTHLLRDEDNSPNYIIEIAKAYYCELGNNLKAAVLVGEDMHLPFGADSYRGKESPELFQLSTLNLKPTDEFKILPTMILPNSDDPYSVKKDQIIFAFNKFSDRSNYYGDNIRGYNYWTEPSESYMVDVLSPLGNVTWRVDEKSISEISKVFNGKYRMVAFGGHGLPDAVHFNTWSWAMRTWTEQLNFHNINTPVLLLSGCYTQGWGGGIDNEELDPPNPYIGCEFIGHMILTNDDFRLIMTGQGGVCGDTDHNMSEPDIIAKLAAGKTFAEAVIGDDFGKGDCIFYGDPTFHFTIIPDQKPPETAHRLKGKIGNNNWYVSPVEIELTAEDDMSGVDKTYYAIDHGPFQLYEQPFIIKTDGTHVISYYSIDLAGNQEQIKQVTVKIDTHTPKTQAILPPSPTPYYPGPVTVTLKANDEPSGVKSTFYRVAEVDNTGVDNADKKWCIYKEPFIVSGSGVHVVEFFSVDNAGNKETVKSVTFIIPGKTELNLAMK